MQFVKKSEGDIFQGYNKQISQDQELCVFSFFPSQILDDGTYWEKRTLRGNTEKIIFAGTVIIPMVEN